MSNKKNKNTEAVETASVEKKVNEVVETTSVEENDSLMEYVARIAELEAEIESLKSQLEESEAEKASLNEVVEVLQEELDQYTTGEKNTKDEYAHIPLRVCVDGKTYTKDEIIKDKKLLKHFKK